MNYTKGEWYWEYNDQMHHNLRAKSTHRSGCEEDKHILFIAPDFLGEDSLASEADAQLIASAPDLYEALKELSTIVLGVIEYHRNTSVILGMDSFTLQPAMKALAKAEGE